MGESSLQETNEKENNNEVTKLVKDDVESVTCQEDEDSPPSKKPKSAKISNGSSARRGRPSKEGTSPVSVKEEKSE